MSQENLQLLRAWIEAFNRRDRDALARLNHPAIEWRTSVEDPECFAVGNDRVFTTNRFSGHSANGVPMDWLLTTVSTYDEGLVVRVTEYFDRNEALEAVGLPE